jgi:YD repeat-containing protein
VERDGAGAPAAIVGPFGQRTTLARTAEGYLSEIANPAGEAFRAEYTPGGLLTAYTDPRGNTRRYTYDDAGRLIEATDPAGGTKTLTRADQAGGHSVALTSAVGRTTTYAVEHSPGGPEGRTVTGPDGLSTVWVDDPTAGTFVSETPDGVRTDIKVTLDPRWGRQVFLPELATIAITSGLTATASATRAVELADPANPLSLAAQIDTVALNGRVYTGDFESATRTHVVTTPEGRQVVTTFDAQGRVIRTELIGLLPTEYGYDAHGELSTVTQGPGAEARSFAFGYDATGELATISDPLGRMESFSYDAAGRVIAQTLPNGQSISYAYDPNGNLAAVTPPGQAAHLFVYTPIDLAEEYSPRAVLTPGGSTLYSYNPDRQLARVTRPDGQAVDLTYDAAGPAVRSATRTTPPPDSWRR